MGAVREGPDGARTMLPSDLGDLEHRHGLTPAEAETVWNEVHRLGRREAAVVKRIKASRVVYRDSYDARPR